MPSRIASPTSGPSLASLKALKNAVSSSTPAPTSVS